jgi:hypothetical protein
MGKQTAMTAASAAANDVNADNSAAAMATTTAGDRGEEGEGERARRDLAGGTTTQLATMQRCLKKQSTNEGDQGGHGGQ